MGGADRFLARFDEVILLVSISIDVASGWAIFIVCNNENLILLPFNVVPLEASSAENHQA